MSFTIGFWLIDPTDWNYRDCIQQNNRLIFSLPMINSCELVIREKNKMKYFNIHKNIKYINVIRAHPKNLFQIFLQILARP